MKKFIILLILSMFYNLYGRETRLYPKNKHVVLLVHGMIFERKNNLLTDEKYWGCPITKEGLIGNLQTRGLIYKGLLKSKDGTVTLNDTGGAIAKKGESVFYSVSFSEAANADGFTGRVIELVRFVERAKKSEGVSKVTIVGHSAGGLVARSYLQSKEYKNDVRRLITIGTPHMGASLSNLAKLTQIFGKRADSMTSDSAQIKQLNQRTELPTSCEYISLLARSYNQRVIIGTSKKCYQEHCDTSQHTHTKLPLAFKEGFDGAVQILSQNLALTKAGVNYENIAKKPIPYILIPGLPTESWHSESLSSKLTANVIYNSIFDSVFDVSKKYAGHNAFFADLALIKKNISPLEKFLSYEVVAFQSKFKDSCVQIDYSVKYRVRQLNKVRTGLKIISLMGLGDGSSLVKKYKIKEVKKDNSSTYRIDSYKRIIKKSWK